MAAEGPSWFGLPALHLGTHKRPPPGANDATTGKEKQLLRPTRPPTNSTNAPAKPHAPVPTKNPSPHRMPQSQPPRRCPCTAPTQPPRRLLGRSRPQLSHTRPHSSYRQRRGTSWGLQEQVKQQNHGRRGGTSTSRAPAEPPPLATFWTPTHPHTGLQAPPEPPATEGSEQARGGRDWGRCWCIFAHVAAAATRARTHGSLWHIFSTVLAISEVLKPLRAPLARVFWAGRMTPVPLLLFAAWWW